MHEIYAEWRRLFDRYTPPLTAVAEAWVPAERRIRYATEQGLGQAFNFDLLKATWDAAQFRRIVEENLDLSAQSGSSSTWVFSNHDIGQTRHPVRPPLHRQRGPRVAPLPWRGTAGGPRPGPAPR